MDTNNNPFLILIGFKLWIDLFSNIGIFYIIDPSSIVLILIVIYFE